MNKFLFSLCLVIGALPNSFAQKSTGGSAAKAALDTSMAAKKEQARFAKMASMAYFPLINAGTYSGVLPVAGIDEIPDPKKDYKLLFEFTMNPKDSTHSKINPGLVEIARIINLHVASGIPMANIHPVIVVHGPSLMSIRKNEIFQKNFKKDNPNSKLIDDLMKNGVKVIACGQAMNFLNVTKEELYAGVKVSLTAQTVLSNYIGQGYVLYGINEGK